MATLADALAGSDCTVHVEPGRYLVGSAGVLLTRALYRTWFPEVFYDGGWQFVLGECFRSAAARATA